MVTTMSPPAAATNKPGQSAGAAMPDSDRIVAAALGDEVGDEQ
jgi:hypothetical protein